MDAEGSETDRDVVARQIGREPRAFRRVAVRCPFGRPAVTEQSPYDPQGEPFPTTYYVTCRHLVAAISRLEAAGGVERWSRLAAGDKSLRASREEADALQRRIRAALAAGATGRDGGASLLGGIGGAGRTGSLKCLHAHAGFALANPGYELGERILAELPEPWPDRCCSEASLASGAVAADETELVQHEWEAGHDRLEEERGDRRRYETLLRQIEIVTEELRKQVGQTYTLAELGHAYRGAERWAREIVEERAPSPGWPRDLALVLAAAFHAYRRGASDFRA